ncbi:hypothetical protein [Ruegeria arenilitoris]|uniref:hypothetical protein n=1 Tax=Ruegeria arenilitoris TaxID=1173585 RepID=UPI00147E75DC|nr:hypothetical protein [Ruegeria arenilitoris]
MPTKYQKLLKARDEAVRAVVQSEMYLVEVEAKLATAEEGAKLTAIDLDDVDNAAQKRAEDLQRVIVLRDMHEAALEAHVAAKKAAAEAYDATATFEYEQGERDMVQLMDEMEPIIHQAHALIRDAALVYHARLNRQPIASVQSPLDQMLMDMFHVALKGENYKGSTSHRDVNTIQKIKDFYGGKFGSQYGRDVHLHLTKQGLWHQQPRESEAYRRGLTKYEGQKAKRTRKAS